MELIRYQEELLHKTDHLMKENNLIEEENYAKFFGETIDLKTWSKEIELKLQLKNEEKIVKQLKKLGWKIGHKYYTNGAVNWCSDGNSKDNYGDVEMIQLVYK